MFNSEMMKSPDRQTHTQTDTRTQPFIVKDKAGQSLRNVKLMSSSQQLINISDVNQEIVFDLEKF